MRNKHAFFTHQHRKIPSSFLYYLDSLLNIMKHDSSALGGILEVHYHYQTTNISVD